MGVACMWGFGMLGGAVQIIVKREDPVSSIFNFVGELFSGSWFPIEVLPAWLRQLSFVMPQYYIMEMMRQTTLSGRFIMDLGNVTLGLFASTLVFLAVGVILFKKAVAVAKAQGTVTFF